MKNKHISIKSVYNNIIDKIYELEEQVITERAKQPSMNSLLNIHALEASIEALRHLSNDYAE